MDNSLIETLRRGVVNSDSARRRHADVEGLHFVYFVIPKVPEPERMKIGITGNLSRRLSELETGSGQEMACIYHISFNERSSAQSAEQLLHRVFYEHRLKGEWFKFNAETFGIIPYLEEEFFQKRENSHG